MTNEEQHKADLLNLEIAKLAMEDMLGALGRTKCVDYVRIESSAKQLTTQLDILIANHRNQLPPFTPDE